MKEFLVILTKASDEQQIFIQSANDNEEAYELWIKDNPTKDYDGYVVVVPVTLVKETLNLCKGEKMNLLLSLTNGDNGEQTDVDFDADDLKTAEGQQRIIQALREAVDEVTS